MVCRAPLDWDFVQLPKSVQVEVDCNMQPLRLHKASPGTFLADDSSIAFRNCVLLPHWHVGDPSADTLADFIASKFTGSPRASASVMQSIVMRSCEVRETAVSLCLHISA